MGNQRGHHVTRVRYIHWLHRKSTWITSSYMITSSLNHLYCILPLVPEPGALASCRGAGVGAEACEGGRYRVGAGGGSRGGGV